MKPQPVEILTAKAMFIEKYIVLKSNINYVNVHLKLGKEKLIKSNLIET